MEKASTNKNPNESPDVPSAVQLAVGGMTCIACVRTLTDAVSELEGVSEISVNLLGKSASVVVARTAIVDSMVTLIKDIGYECQLIAIMPIKSADASGRVEKTRTVALEIKGTQSM
jgi:Cu+-exporting ATPase